MIVCICGVFLFFFLYCVSFLADLPVDKSGAVQSFERFSQEIWSVFLYLVLSFPFCLTAQNRKEKKKKIARKTQIANLYFLTFLYICAFFVLFALCWMIGRLLLGARACASFHSEPRKGEPAGERVFSPLRAGFNSCPDRSTICHNEETEN